MSEGEIKDPVEMREKPHVPTLSHDPPPIGNTFEKEPAEKSMVLTEMSTPKPDILT